MTRLYPRLPKAEANRLFASVGELQPSNTHHAQVFAPVGGRRATPDEIDQFANKLRATARRYAFPEPLAASERLAFDREAPAVLTETLTMSWSEASSRDVWSFFALVAIPDVTRWRFGEDNVERWVATDLTRHTWARAWWRGTVFAGHEDLLGQLTESDLNQILERRAIGGDPRLSVGIARALLEADAQHPGYRRTLIRESAARLRRRLAFIDARALSDDGILDLCRAMVNETAAHLPVGEVDGEPATPSTND
jgi:hypothetical protein